MGEPKVVFVRVKEGARELPCWDVELRRSDELTFEGLLKATLRTHSKDVVRLAEREVTVKMAPKADERGAVCITSAAVTVWSRLGAGNFIFFNVGQLLQAPAHRRRGCAGRRCAPSGLGQDPRRRLQRRSPRQPRSAPRARRVARRRDHQLLPRDATATGRSALRGAPRPQAEPLPQLVVHPEAHGDRG